MLQEEPMEREASNACFRIIPTHNMWGGEIHKTKTTSPPMMPDMAAMITAMTEVTIAIPPRTPESHTFKDVYIHLAIPDRSSRDAMKINKGIEIST